MKEGTMQRLAFVGFGTVGQGLAKILLDKKRMLKDKYGFEYSVVAISDFQKGSVYHPDGLDLDRVLSLVEQKKSISEYPSGTKGWDALRTITESSADTILELTYTNVQTGQPALDHCRAAFKHGKHVVTSNKGPLVVAYRELQDLADRNKAQFRFEGTVVSGTPIINMATRDLAGCTIIGIKGILNGTTNYILSEMEKGKSYDAVLKRAQELGYAEADPTGDVEGWDALAKVVILSNVVLGGNIKAADVQREGITGISLEDVKKASKEGYRWKLIGETRVKNGKIVASVSPQKLPLSDPLASVMGATNALTFETDLLGSVTVVGPGAGKSETGFSILTDLLDINRTIK
jgi:homoserine dehydrogenase